MSSKKNSIEGSLIPIASRIINMASPYLERYQDKILGIYLSPYKAGENEHIEIVVVKDTDRELPILAEESTINNVRLFLAVWDRSNYKSYKTEMDYKLAKDLKGGYIVYDPKRNLVNKQAYLRINDEIAPFYNGSELPDELVETVKVNLISRK